MKLRYRTRCHVFFTLNSSNSCNVNNNLLQQISQTCRTHLADSVCKAKQSPYFIAITHNIQTHLKHLVP